MIKHWELEKDTYITDKIVGNVRRSSDANVGYASTLDLYKLWNESNLKGSVAGEAIVEKSRLLLDMDLSALKSSLETRMNPDDSTLKIELFLKDIQGTQVAPNDFTVTIHPITTSWNEGLGTDLAAFSDIGSASWNSADPSNDWTTPGGDYGAPIISQSFPAGSENLRVDITAWVRTVWDGLVDNNGLLLKFADEIEANEYSYFVKRFASRHTRNPYNKPKLIVSWEDFHEDDRLQFETATTNTLAIKHYIKGELAPLDNVTTQLTYGTWSLDPTSISNVSVGGIEKVGWFQAEYRGIEIYGVDSALQTDLLANGSIDLTETWYSNGAVWYQGTVTLTRNLIVTYEKARDYRFHLMEMKAKYTQAENPVVRLFCRDKRIDNEPVRRPLELQSLRVERAYYRIKDFSNQTEPVVDFSYPLSEATRLSSDGKGMYFSFPTDLLPHGRLFTIDILYFDRGKKYIWESNVSFEIVSI